jgi:hypothetical protein
MTIRISQAVLLTALFAILLMLGGFLIAGAVREDGLFGAITAAWVQAIGSMVAIGVAIAVPAMIEADRRKSDAQALRDRRIAAFHAMRAVALELRLHPEMMRGQLAALDGMLAGIDHQVLTPRASDALAHFRMEIIGASAAAETEFRNPIALVFAHSLDVEMISGWVDGAREDMGILRTD